MQIIHALQQWWQQQTSLEIIGVITGLLCVYLAAVNSIWNWPVAVISVGVYFFIFFGKQLYSDMALQVYFMGTNFYGWYFWSKKASQQLKIPVVSATRKQLLYSAAIIVVVTPLLGYTWIKLSSVLRYEPVSYPYLDAFCTACSLVAQIFLARKILENWLIWIFVDIIYVCVYLLKGLDLTAIMYAIFIAIAFLGYFDWKKDYNKGLRPEVGMLIAE